MPLYFPEGLVGQETWRRFLLEAVPEAEIPLYTLRSLDDAHVSFLLADPRHVVPSYVARLSPSDRARIGLRQGEAPDLYCTLVLGADRVLRSNLLGPLAVNPRSGLGVQLVLVGSRYSATHVICQVGEG